MMFFCLSARRTLFFTESKSANHTNNITQNDLARYLGVTPWVCRVLQKEGKDKHITP